MSYTPFFERKLSEEKRAANILIKYGQRNGARHTGICPHVISTLSTMYFSRRGLFYTNVLSWENEAQARLTLIIIAWGILNLYNARVAHELRASLLRAGMGRLLGEATLSAASRMDSSKTSDYVVELYNELKSIPATVKALEERGFDTNPEKVRQAIYAADERYDRDTAQMAINWSIHGPSAAAKYGLSEEDFLKRVSTVIKASEAESVARDFLAGMSLKEAAAVNGIDVETVKTYCCLAPWVFRVELDLNDPAWGDPIKQENLEHTHIILEGTDHREMLEKAVKFLKGEPIDESPYRVFPKLRDAIRNTLTKPGENIRTFPVGQGNRTKEHREAQRARAEAAKKSREQIYAIEPHKTRLRRRYAEKIKLIKKEAAERSRAKEKNAEISEVAGGPKPKRRSKRNLPPG
jgi:hypothetical protein